MTAVLEPTSDVIEATPEELKIAARNAVASSGFTLTELLEQASHDDFETSRALMSWRVLRNLWMYLQESPDDPGTNAADVERARQWLGNLTVAARSLDASRGDATA